jgi:hypothetical protein
MLPGGTAPAVRSDALPEKASAAGAFWLRKRVHFRRAQPSFNPPQVGAFLTRERARFRLTKTSLVYRNAREGICFFRHEMNANVDATLPEHIVMPARAFVFLDRAARSLNERKAGKS